MRTWLLTSVLLCGCSGAIQNGFTTTSDDGGDAATDTSVGPTNTCQDGGLFDHQPGSWILTSPKLHLIFWGNYWTTNGAGAGEVAIQTTEWNVLANDPGFYNPVSQYGVGSGVLAGVFLSNWSVPVGQITDDYITGEIDKEIGNGTLPASDNQSLYMVLLPPETQSQYDVQNKFGGHHGSHNGYTFAVAEHVNDPTGIIAHEAWEAFTDPDDGSGWWGAGGETEVADLCQGNSTTWVLDGYNLPQVWSQKDCQCEP